MQKSTLTRTLFLITVAILICVAIVNFSHLSSFFTGLLGILSPILLGLAMAFILNIPLKLLERLWDRIDKNHSRRSHGIIKRITCIGLCLLALAGIVIALIFAVFPQLKNSILGLVNSLPILADRANGYWQYLVGFMGRYGFKLPEININADKILGMVKEYFTEHGHMWIDISFDVVSGVITAIFDIILATVIAVYVLAKKEALAAQLNKLLSAIMSDEHKKSLLRISSLCSRTFTGFITGQLLEALILGGLCLFGMLAFRLPFAVLISTLIGVTALIPIFGAFIGIALGAFFILLVDPVKAIWFVVFMIVLQQIEGNLIYPKVMGKSVGLPGFWVLIAVTIGSSFGILGMLISVPLCSVAYSLTGQIVKDRLEKKNKNKTV